MKSKDTVLVLLSGGIDSAVLLWWAKKRWDVTTLTFLFPGRRKQEILATKRLRTLSGSLKNFEVLLPTIDPPKAEESCYIPQRNLVYYGIAASLAEKMKYPIILGAHIQHDREVFSDASPNYFKKLNHLIQWKNGSKKKIELLFPFIRFSKKRVVQIGNELGVPYPSTWSCSKDVQRHCWQCRSCLERRQGFLEAGVEDPLYHES